ncbi:MAG: hypothetical protein U0V02_00250 [Anaerolineales bacterium]
MKTNSERLNILILTFGLLLGAYTRLLPTIMVGFPVSDGGLFYVMVKALQANHYIVPAFVEFNGISMPFAYPPLGFYVAGLASDVFHIPLIEVFRWMPAIGSIFFSVAFYPLATSVLKSNLKGTLATVFFALMPRSISFYIMGGGITRVLGMLFLILTLFSAHKLFTTHSKKYIWMTILFGSGVVLSHPEATLHTVSLCLVLWIFFGISKEGIKHALLVAIGILALTSPFFAFVISRHGVQPYLSAAQTGFQSTLAWLAILTGSFSDEKFVTVLSALALLGLVISLTMRNFLLIVLLFVPAFVDPRSAASISLMAWAMLAAIGVVEVVIPGVYALQNPSQGIQDIEEKWDEYFINSSAIKFTLTGLIFYAFFGAVLSDQVYLKVSLTSSDRSAMNWVASNIPHESKFVILTGETETFADAISEWFPVLAKNTSVATVQGYEWIPDKPFQTKLDEYYILQSCMNKAYPCVEQWATSTGNQFEYLLISQDGLLDKEDPTLQNPLLTSLMDSTSYQMVYQKADVAIFKILP